ncbi:kinase-like domain-containing protein [Paraphoma chrysanthemicola]|nr:kinase-like domain-containing protein [Paraphoma chrysanthemicola]
MAPTYPSCERARERLVGHRVIPHSRHLPRGPVSYFPRSAVVKVLTEFPVGRIFTCSCYKCLLHVDLRGGLDGRRKGLDEQELLGPYATVYGLLIFLRYPFLISLFLEHSKNLENGYFSKDNLKFLRESRTLDAEQVDIIVEEIIEGQYRFHVRKFSLRKTVSRIGEAEILPIDEDIAPVGKGDFGQVYAFDCPPEYMDEMLVSKKISRFARKIFDERWTETDAVKEWVHHLHANDLNHNNLMEAFAAFHHGSYFFIVVELAQCTLWNFLAGSDKVRFSSQELWTQAQGLASGLAYLHGRKVKGGRQENETLYHLDLKPSNILIVNNIMKISDFGLSDYKEFPRMSESILVGDSKHAGVKVYAPPSRAGPPSDRYDVYSLATILSEIASYDVGKEASVSRFRENRGCDGQCNDDSIYFYYPTTGELKQSVVEEYRRILQTVNKSPEVLVEMEVDRWQEGFYHQSLFDLLKQMLHPLEPERPTAMEVVTTLDSLVHQASRALRGSELVDIDIWDATVKGTLMNAKPPQALTDCRLRASIDSKHCGLWLYPDEKGLTIKLRQFLFNRGIEQTVEDVYRTKRRPYKSIKLSYTDSVVDYKISLIHYKDESAISYVFPTLHV